MTPLHDSSRAELEGLAKQSPSRTLRRITDHCGGYWYWPAEQATHAEGAAYLDIPYDLPPGAGEIVVIG